MPLTRGAVFAGYRIQRLLGAGGMGEVYLAKHPRLPRFDALKILPARLTSDAEFRARFHREAELAATLYHAHIVGVHDRGEYDGQLWISMDFVDGTDAATLAGAQSGSSSVAEVLDIVEAVADALDFAHEQRLLHRDVKPANILLTTPAVGRRRILLADFGIARHADEASGLTSTNVAVGTLSYAAPEQLLGQALDGRADQYALAATAFHLLAGHPPFQDPNPAVVISMHLATAPPRLAESRPDLGCLDGVLARGLAKAPADRYPTCLELAAELRAAYLPVAAPAGLPATAKTIATPQASPPPEMTVAADVFAAMPTQHRATLGDSGSSEHPAPVRSRWWRRRAVLAIGAAAVVIALVTGFVVSAVGGDESTVAATKSGRPGFIHINRAVAEVAPPDPTVAAGSAIAAVGPSVVKVDARSGPSNRCADRRASGFVIAPDRVVTTALAVAGSEAVTVESEGAVYQATVVSYQPDSDIAFLAVPELPSPPMATGSQPARQGADVVALGYPGTGELRATPARVRELISLDGPDLYDTVTLDREVYVFTGAVSADGWGGPLVDVNGQVLGLVVATNADDPNMGFALSADELISHTDEVGSTRPVSTGDCVA